MAELRWVCVLYCTALHVHTGALIVGRDAFVIFSGFVWDSFEIRSGCLSSCLPPCMRVGRTVLYCTTCRYGSLREPSFFGRDAFGMFSQFVRYAFGMPAFLPASLMHAGSRYSYQYGTSYHEYRIRTSVVPGVGRTVLSVRRCGRDAAIPPTKFVQP